MFYTIFIFEQHKHIVSDPCARLLHITVLRDTFPGRHSRLSQPIKVEMHLFMAMVWAFYKYILFQFIF